MPAPVQTDSGHFIASIDPASAAPGAPFRRNDPGSCLHCQWEPEVSQVDTFQAAAKAAALTLGLSLAALFVGLLLAMPFPPH